MSTVAPEPSSSPPPPPRRGRPLIAWLVIATLVSVAVGYQLYANHFADTKDRSYLSEVEMQARYLVGVRMILPGSGTSLYQEAKSLNRGPYEQRLRFVVL